MDKAIKEAVAKVNETVGLSEDGSLEELALD